MTPGSTEIIVDVASVKRAHHTEMPNRQFRRRGRRSQRIIEEAQSGVSHQMLGIGTRPGSDVRKLGFLLRREMHFHTFQTMREPASRQFRCLAAQGYP